MLPLLFKVLFLTDFVSVACFSSIFFISSLNDLSPTPRAGFFLSDEPPGFLFLLLHLRHRANFIRSPSPPKEAKAKGELIPDLSASSSDDFDSIGMIPDDEPSPDEYVDEDDDGGPADWKEAVKAQVTKGRSGRTHGTKKTFFVWRIVEE